jgi:nucleotide-binding universal stress UspA family protein
MLPIRTILHPTDFSNNAAYALQLACSLARDHGARLIVLHAHRPPVTVLGGTAAISPLPIEEEIEDLEAQLQELKIPISGITVDRKLLQGEPVTSIVEFAQRVPCDLIIMGTHGRRGLRHLLMGSVAEQVVRKAPCPVLTVRVPYPIAVETPASGSRQAVGAAAPISGM